MVKLALEYELETGRSGFDFTPTELLWRTRTLEEREKVQRINMARAVAVAMSSNEEAWDSLR